MRTATPRHEDFVDDFFVPTGRETPPTQEDAPPTCFLCGKPSLPSERGIHPDCAREENLSEDCDPVL